MAISKRQYTAIRKVLMQPKACRVAGKYVARNGDTCAIGALALDAGIPKSWFWREYRNDVPVYRTNLVRVINTLKEKYGLSQMAIEELQKANDNVCPRSDIDEDTLHKQRLETVLKALKRVYDDGI